MNNVSFKLLSKLKNGDCFVTYDYGWKGFGHRPESVEATCCGFLILRKCCSVFYFHIFAVAGQHSPKNKRPKEQGENRIKPTNKKAKPKIPKVKDRDSTDSTAKSQSIMMQAMGNGRFQRPAATVSLLAGQTLELRCKGSKVEWSYPAYLDTFKDSRLTWASLTSCSLCWAKGLVFLPSSDVLPLTSTITLHMTMRTPMWPPLGDGVLTKE